jgi:uncharacterized protein (DUF2236 family)
MSALDGNYPRTWKPPSLIKNPVYRGGFWLAVGLYAVWSLTTLDIDWDRTTQGFERSCSCVVSPRALKWR